MDDGRQRNQCGYRRWGCYWRKCPRTPGYWKNWSSCSGGGQYAKTTDDVDPDNEFVSLDEVLNAPGVSWGNFTIDDCPLAVSILDQRDSITDKKMASDAAYTLAMHLLAAQLNYGAGAETCTAASDAIVDAEALLVEIGDNGFDATVRGVLKSRSRSTRTGSKTRSVSFR